MTGTTVRHPALDGCPDPFDDLEGFLTWHRTGPLAGFTMTGPDQPPAPAPVPQPPATPPADPPRTFTQDEVTRLATREKEQGERAARRQLATDLGLDPETFDPAAVRAALEAQTAAQRATETEAERKLREAEAREAAADAREKAAAARELSLRKTSALTSAGLVLPADPAERDATLAQAASLLDIPADAPDDVLRTALDTLKARLPGLFSTTPPPTPPRAPSGGPSGTPPRTPPASTGDAYDRGAERAKKLAAGSSAT